eukprot:s2736_g3.t1
MFCLRIGEAAHPGPPESPLVLGLANPSGLTGKAQSFLDLPPGIWNVAETQATDVGFQRFVRELKAFQAPSRNLRAVHGAFAPPRAGSRVAGSWTGVAQISDIPVRALQVPWRGHEHASGRTNMASFHVGAHCLVGAVVYAPPSGPTYGDPRALTADLLATVTEELVLGRQGPRFVAGDFNAAPSDHVAFQHWRSLGWTECQDLALSWFQVQPMPTCKHSTRPDHIWISPELQRWVTDVTVHDDIFADHSVLQTHLLVPHDSTWQHTWRSPSVLPWAAVPVSGVDFPDQVAFSWTPADLTHSFQVWSHAAEQEIIEAVSSHTHVPPACVGRGQTLDVTSRAASLVPIGPGRHGDVLPRSSLLGRLVHRWFQQLRRLQAYVRRAASLSSSPALQADQCCTWKNILSAKGFKPSFREWWLCRSKQLHGSPNKIPELPPSVEIARALFLDFELNYRALEAWHLRQRTKIVQAKHFHHNKLLFKQLKPQKAGSVSHIKVTQEAQVTEVSGNLLELDSPLDFQSVASWTLNGLSLSVTATDSPSQVAIVLPDDVDPPQVGSQLQATSYLTQFDDIERALYGLWDPIWRRHAGLADSHWDRIVAFGKAFLPARVPSERPWTSSRVQKTIHGYKKHATRGPDAWDRNDLASLSAVRMGDLADLFGLVESGQAWPQQLLTGFVCPIAKCEGAELPTHFRPIVLLSLLYRMWASASAKAFLPVLLSMMPEQVFGFIPGKRSTDLWSLMQLAIDVAGACQAELVGYNADLVKCFNRLPRAPLLALLRHLGLSVSTATAWKHALASLARRFRILADVGPAHFSDTGFPEGDPLSCVAMLGFNMVFDCYLRQYAPQCIPWCFVDNLQLLSTVASALHAGTLVMNTFMDAWDLTLDPSKSFTWATTTKQRAHLKAMGHLVRLASKDLGAQMHYSHRPSREVLKQRLASVGHFWTLLRHSSASSWFRCQAIRVAAWPKVLHSCESAWISASTLDTLRSKCMYALKWDRAGASPLVRWALMQPLGDDPAFFQLWHVFESFWRLSRQYDFVRAAWAATVFTAKFTTGFLHAFRAALAEVDWVLDEQWILSGSWFSISWDLLALTDLKKMLAEAWTQTICARLGHRQDFQGLSTIDVQVSFGSVKPTDKATAELIATIQDGTFCTNNVLSKFDPDKAAICVHCGRLDDLEHRCLHCPVLAAVRQQHEQAAAEWHLRPRAFTDHGLVERNPFLLDHWRNLLQMVPTFERFFVHPANGGHYEVFTDGTCKEPRSKIKSLAAWAVVEMGTNQILARGMVPGLTQSSDIAELCAVLSALLWALRFGVSLCIHSDSAYVVDGLRVLRHSQAVPRQWKHQSYWKQVHDALVQLDPAQWDVHKLRSHQDFVFAASPLEEWWIMGNDRADAAAAEAFECATSQFQQTYASLCHHHDMQVTLVQRQLAFLVAIAKFELEHRGPSSFDDEDMAVSFLCIPRFVCDRSIVDQVELDVLEQLTEQQTSPFPVQFGKEVLSYLLDLDMTASHARVVTGIELMAGFLAAGNAIPIQRFVDGRLVYEAPSTVRGGGLIRSTIATLLKTFKLAVVKFLTEAGVQFSVQLINRPDIHLCVKHWGIFIGWPDQSESVVSNLVRSRLRSLVRIKIIDINIYLSSNCWGSPLT